MDRKTRSRRTTATLRTASLGDHLCWAYHGPDAFHATLAPYVADGLVAGQRVAVYVPGELYGATLNVLAGAIPGFERTIERGALVLGVSEEAYLENGMFDPDKRIAGYAAMAERAVADGYEGVRVMGDATCVLSEPSFRDGWPAYELRADLLAARSPLIALCGYDRVKCPPEALEMLRRVHASAVEDWGDPLGFHIHAADDGRLAIAGEIDFATSGQVARIIGDAISDVRTPTVDVSDLGFIDVAGMRALSYGAAVLAARHPKITFTGTGPTFRRIWELLACQRTIDAEVALR